MNEGYQLALSLLLIGMVTVFVILTLVVFGGRLLIALSNRITKEPAIPVEPQQEEDIPVAIIAAVVQHITAGKGKISSIKKIE